MHVGEKILVVWALWGMLLTGLALALASLWHTSERFWHWKRARQIANGEAAPAAASIQARQRFTLAPSEINTEGNAFEAGPYPLSDSECGLAGHVVGWSRRGIMLRLEPEAITREDVQMPSVQQTLSAGQCVTVQVTGSSELFQFTAPLRGVRADAEQPFCTLLEVRPPAWVARVQRRQHVRARLQCGVVLRVEEATGKEQGAGETWRGVLRDLSGGGARLELDGACSPEAIARLCAVAESSGVLNCRLDMPLLREFPLRLRLHSCRRMAVRGGLSACVRGEFILLPSWQQETLVSVVFQAQREHLRQHAPRFQTV